MKSLKSKFFILLLVFTFVCSENVEIQNGETIELKPELTISYNFTIPENKIYSVVVFLFKVKCTSYGDIYITEDENIKSVEYNTNSFTPYRLSSIYNKTIYFKLKEVNEHITKFTLIDLTKEMNVDFDNFLYIMNSFDYTKIEFNPVNNPRFNIKKINSDQTFYFIEINKYDKSLYKLVGLGIIEYCFDDNCLNNVYNSSKVIHFKKGSKYKIRYNFFKHLYSDIYIFIGLDGIKYTQPQPLNNKGMFRYTIDKSNLQRFYLVDKERMNDFTINSNHREYLQLCFITKDILNNLLESLEKLEWMMDYFYPIKINNDSDYALIAFKDNENYDINVFYIYDKSIHLTNYFSKLTIPKNNYIIIATTKIYYNNYFISYETSKPSIRLFNDTDSSVYTQVFNEQSIAIYNEDEDFEFKMRYYQIDTYTNNLIHSWNNYKLDYYLNEYGNTDSYFVRINSDGSNYYGLLTYFIFDIYSEYYFYFNRIFGEVNVYRKPINDYTNLQKYLDIIKSYKYEKKFKLINDRVIIIKGSQIISTFLHYHCLGDIYIQKVEDNSNIQLNKNDITGNLVKLLKENKLYYLDFNVNHLIKLHKDFSDATIEFYDSNNQIIDTLNSDKRVIELSGQNIKVISSKNAFIYLYSKISPEKKMKEIIFPQDKAGMNLYFSLTNINSDNEFVYIIKDLGFENHYPMVNSTSWIKIYIEKENTTRIYAENPYDIFGQGFLEENEKFIIYIANEFDENGRPFFEEDKFEFGELKFNKNLFHKDNKYNFQFITMNREDHSLVLSQSNKYGMYFEVICINRPYYAYDIFFNASNSNVSNHFEFFFKNNSFSKSIQKNEIMNIKLIYDSYSEGPELIFLYNFRCKEKQWNYFSNFKDDRSNFDIKALDEKNLLVKYNTNFGGYCENYVIISLIDENNNLDSFSQPYYLTKLLTENTNSNYLLETVYGYISSYIKFIVDISDLNTDTNNTFVINIISQQVNYNDLKFGSASEFIPGKINQIYLYEQNNFGYNENNEFIYNHTDESISEFMIVINTNTRGCRINIEGHGLSISKSFDKYGNIYEVYFILNETGYLMIDILDSSGGFKLFPLKREINITGFNEQNYFFDYSLSTDIKQLINIYNIQNLTEDKMIYFSCDNCKNQFEVYDISSQESYPIEKFFKFSANKNYIINVFTNTLKSYERYIIKPYVITVFKKDYIKQNFEFGIINGNEPHIYSTTLINYPSYFVNINSFASFYSQNKYYTTDEIYETLPIMNFTNISQYFELKSNYYNIPESYKMLVIPKFNTNLKAFENYTIGFSNKLNVNSGSNFDLNLGKNEFGFIIIDDNNSLTRNPLGEYYNILNVIKSQENNLKLIDSNGNFSEYQQTLVLNSIENHPNLIYIDKSLNDNIVEILYFGPRYAYFYALYDFNLKNKLAILNDGQYFSYFERINTNSRKFYDYINYITFDIQDKINIYIKKYYGYSYLYEINDEKYDINNISFIDKPLRNYDNGISVLNQLFTLMNNKIYSGYINSETLYDIYIDIDNNNNAVILKNKYNNLMKLFKPDITYNLNFEVNHLIKLDPNFDSQITITDSEKTILINKASPITNEIKGNNILIRTNKNSILYFYSPLSKISTDLNRTIFQYELKPLSDKNLILEIDIINGKSLYFYYLVDFGFEGYSPLLSPDSYFKKKYCYPNCKIYIPNNYNNLDQILVEQEKLFLYYYIDNYFNNSENKIAEIKATYNSSIGQLNSANNFFIISPNEEKEEENSIIFNFNNNEKLSLQVHYCPNYEETNVSINYSRLNNSEKNMVVMNTSQILVLNGSNNEDYILTFESNNKFILSYSFHDLTDNIINKYSNWLNERVVNFNLFMNAKINRKEKTLSIQFISNFMYSSTKYYIIIGPKTGDLTLDDFNDHCFLVELINKNSNKVKIYELIDIGNEYVIETDIDISLLLSQYGENQEYIVNIISQELRYQKSLNFYKAKIIKNTKEFGVNINEEFFFKANSKYELPYKRPNNINQICILMPKINSISFELLIEKQNSESISYIINNQTNFITFECDYDGSYIINIIPSINSPIYGIFKIFSTGIAFNLDINDFFLFNFNFTINYQPSNLNITVDTLCLPEEQFIQLKHSNIKMSIRNNSIEDFFIFRTNQKYEIIAEFLKINNGEKYIKYNLEIIDSLKYEIKNLSLGYYTFSNINYTFIKINYTQTPKIELETNENPKFYVSTISKSDFISFPLKISELKFEEITDSTVIKKFNREYAILLLNLNPIENYAKIRFINKVEYKNIYFDNIYEIIDEFTFYNFNFYSSKDFEVIMIEFNFTEEYMGEIIIENTESKDKEKEEKILYNISNKISDKVYLELCSKSSNKLNFKNLKYDKNLGKFKLTMITGSNGNHKIDIKQNIVEFKGLELSKETSNFEFTFNSIIKENHIKKFEIESDNITEVITISQNYKNKPLMNNYYMFESKYSYYIQINIIKVENKYILNPVKMIEFSKDNIEYLNISKKMTYNAINIDKFILLNFTQYSKINIDLTKSSSTMNKASITYHQYVIFPKEIQNIKFEKIEKNNIEIRKDNITNYIVLLINLKQNLTSVDIKFKNDTDEDSDYRPDDINNGGLSTLNIVLISVSGLIFLVIVVILFIIIKKKIDKNGKTRMMSLKTELMEINKIEFN